MPFLNTLLNNLLDIIFPATCVSCGKNGEDFCISCRKEAPAPDRETAEWIFPLYDYRHPPVKKALHLFKYKGRKRLSRIFAEILYVKILEELSELSVMKNFSDAILIPIPLSPKRLRERGYNQAELLCVELVRLSKTTHFTSPSISPSPSRRGARGEVVLGWDEVEKWGEVSLGRGEVFTLAKNVLIKPKETEHQARIKEREKRLKNLSDSFFVKNNEAVKGRNIILIDDVTTTGATLGEARKVLKRSGARRVIAFTIAH